MTLHDRALQFVEEYRKKNPDFVCYFRQRFKEGRERNWFLGTDTYAFIGLSKVDSGNLTTKSQGLVIYQKDDDFAIKLELGALPKKEEEQELTEKIFKYLHSKGYDFDNRKNYHFYYFDSFEEAETFLDKEYKNIIDMIAKNGFENKLISMDDFLQDYERIKEMQVTSVITKKSVSDIPLNQILYGPPGTGKTFNTIEMAVRICEPTFREENREELKKKYDELHKSGQIVFTTFHQSMTYEDFVEGIKPLDPSQNDGEVAYDIQDGIFKQLCESADSKVSAINSYIEKLCKDTDERDGKEPKQFNEPSKFLLKYTGGKTFRIHPENSKYKDSWYVVNIESIKECYLNDEVKNVHNPTYIKGILEYFRDNGLSKDSAENNQTTKPYVLIIDEINRGNVSEIFGELITLLEQDKRFGQENQITTKLPYSKIDFTVPSNVYIIGTMNTADRSIEALDTALRRRFSFVEMPPNPDLVDYEIGEINIKELLETINCRIEAILDRDHKIGHSYFMGLENVSDLKNCFKNKIIPLLQEYFYDDYGKIGMILGKGFVSERKKVEFADFTSDYFSNDLIMYDLNTDLSGDEFTNAVYTLLKKATVQQAEGQEE